MFRDDVKSLKKNNQKIQVLSNMVTSTFVPRRIDSELGVAGFKQAISDTGYFVEPVFVQGEKL